MDSGIYTWKAILKALLNNRILLIKCQCIMFRKHTTKGAPTTMNCNFLIQPNN